jgi:hypothetical protein
MATSFPLSMQRRIGAVTGEVRAPRGEQAFTPAANPHLLVVAGERVDGTGADDRTQARSR